MGEGRVRGADDDDDRRRASSKVAAAGAGVQMILSLPQPNDLCPEMSRCVYDVDECSRETDSESRREYELRLSFHCWAIG